MGYMTPRKLNALLLMAIGIVLLNGPKLASVFAGASDYVMAGIYFLPGLGFIFIILGIYRFTTKGKDEQS